MVAGTSGEAAAGASDAASSSLLGSLPAEAAKAAAEGDEAALLAWLDNDGRVNATDGANGITALMLSARHGQERVVELLLHRGAQIDLQDSSGNTALMLAATSGHERAVKLLLRRGAEINLQRAATAAPR